MTPLEHYHWDLQSKEFIYDPEQEQAMQYFQRVYEDFVKQQQCQAKFWLKSLNKLYSKEQQPIKGLYVWGGVGAGKTWLMDKFYDCLPTQRKLRIHFHRFMQRVHHDLKQMQGQRDPLKLIARQFAKEFDILCFDEFFVNDITDAMLLAGLLKAIFTNGISLVTTSNVPPDQLYRNGLQRELFLPAIALLKQYTEVIHVQTQADYRLRVLKQAGIYFYPLNDNTKRRLRESYEQITHGKGIADELLMIKGRPIPTISVSNGVVWFDFQDLCNVPRSQLDYLEIAQLYHTVFLSNVPKITAEQDNLICYLINLVDVFYDANIKLIISAAAPISELYTVGRFSFEFKRTQSRLLEMQSEEYLQRSHFSLPHA